MCAEAKTNTNGEDMKKAIIAMVLLGALLPVTRADEEAGRRTRNVAGGYAYNTKEDYHGFWMEGGFRVFRGMEMGITYSKFADPFRYNEVSCVFRTEALKIKRLKAGPEAGYAIGSYTDLNGNQYYGGVTRTWVAGMAAEYSLRPGWSWMMRFNLVNPNTGGWKDDRFRMHFGVKYSF